MVSLARSIRGFTLSLTAAALFSVLSATHAQAAIIITITADEFGNGTLVSGGNPFSLPFSSLTDPGPGGLTGVANYGMLNPPSLVAGDVLLTEGAGVTSDVIRFDPVTGNGTFFFYSLPGGGAPADIGLPSAFLTNTISISEVSLGALGFGATYTPTAGQPGYVSSDFTLTYTFISDSAVPEPSTSMLLLVGVTLFGASTRRNKR